MSGQGAPWMLYFAGAVLALILNWLSVPVLPFALGMFIPLHLNMPLLIGGTVAHFVGKKQEKDGEQAEELAQKRQEKGTLIASGFIAGGALMGVVSAVIKFCGADWFLTSWAGSGAAKIVGIMMYILLLAYFVYAGRKINK